jgi:hypothetical protein
LGKACPSYNVRAESEGNTIIQERKLIKQTSPPVAAALSYMSLILKAPAVMISSSAASWKASSGATLFPNSSPREIYELVIELKD